MGKQANLVIEGTVCQECGIIMDDLIPTLGHILLDPPGYPRSCKDCKEGNYVNGRYIGKSIHY